VNQTSVADNGIGMVAAILVVGGVAGTALIGLLIFNHFYPRLRLWPTLQPWGWRSLLFWSLFRCLNISALALALFDWLPWSGPSPERLLGLSVAIAGAGLYGFACWKLGRGNLYCGREGLVTNGIYRWTRNPQYATAIPAYLGAALASQSWGALTLTMVLTCAFVLMALAEEPWLEATYGETYRRYRDDVARFYHWSPLWGVLRRKIERLERAVKGARP
jgi:protein-S-isoprenylcysteine O-methyltransferase Ste14